MGKRGDSEWKKRNLRWKEEHGKRVVEGNKGDLVEEPQSSQGRAAALELCLAAVGEAVGGP